MPDIDKIKDRIDEIFEEIVQIRRNIHMNPELSRYEEQTSILIQNRLKKLNIDCTGNIAGFGVTGTVYGKDKNHGIGIRAEMDALPINEMSDSAFKSKNKGIMHACGHDVHTAVLLGTAQILNELRDELPLSVRFIFQPAEETVGGAKPMIEQGCLENPKISSVISLHVEPSLPVGHVQFTSGIANAASCEFYVTVYGKPCHGAHPYEGVDPLLPACNMVTAIQSIITRRMNPTDPSLITVGKFSSGTKNNIIPGKSEFSGIIRTLDIKNRDFIKEKIKELCGSIATAYGASCKIRFCDSYPPLKNDEQLFALLLNTMRKIIGTENVAVNTMPCMGADDFAYFCHGCRGLCYNIGAKNPCDKEVYPLHSDKFNPDEECIRTGILSEVSSVLAIMNNERKIWAEL